MCIRKISNKHVEKLLIYSIIGEKKVIHYIGDRDGIPCNLFKDLSDMILSLYYKDNIIFIEKNLFHIVKKIVTGGNSYMCMSNPCGAGLSQFTVAPNADVYPCADLCGQKHFILGNIGEDFFPKIPSCEGWREIRSYKLQNLTGCKKCTLIKTCPAGCSVRCYYSNDSVHSTDPLCGFYKLILPYLDDTGLAKKNIQYLR